MMTDRAVRFFQKLMTIESSNPQIIELQCECAELLAEMSMGPQQKNVIPFDPLAEPVIEPVDSLPRLKGTAFDELMNMVEKEARKTGEPVGFKVTRARKH